MILKSLSLAGIGRISYCVVALWGVVIMNGVRELRDCVAVIWHDIVN
jgi:hypothetical protein